MGGSAGQCEVRKKRKMGRVCQAGPGWTDPQGLVSLLSGFARARAGNRVVEARCRRSSAIAYGSEGVLLAQLEPPPRPDALQRRAGRSDATTGDADAEAPGCRVPR